MSGDVVHVWLVRTDVSGQALAALSALLDDDERRRAEALHLPGHRGRFTAAHGACRLILGHHLDVAPGSLRFERGPHGKPALAGPAHRTQVSISHAGGLTAVAVTTGRRVGVDVEREVAGPDARRMSARFYPPDEARIVASARGAAGQASRFLRLWVRKEACVKASGGRLTQGLALPVAGRGAGGLTVYAPGAALSGPYAVRDLAVPAGCHAALALEGTSGYRVRYRWWPLDM